MGVIVVFGARKGDILKDEQKFAGARGQGGQGGHSGQREERVRGHHHAGWNRGGDPRRHTGKVGLGLTLREGQDRGGGPEWGMGQPSIWELEAQGCVTLSKLPSFSGLPCLLGASPRLEWMGSEPLPALALVLCDTGQALQKFEARHL